MFKRLTLIATVTIAIALTAIGIAPANAQDPETDTKPAEGACPIGIRLESRQSGVLSQPAVILAQTFELTLSQLRSELAEKSIAELASEKGLELTTIVDALIAPRADVLDELLSVGVVTQEEVDACISEMSERLTEQLNTPRDERHPLDLFDGNGEGGRIRDRAEERREERREQRGNGSSIN